jgi:hypothetical protein
MLWGKRISTDSMNFVPLTQRQYKKFQLKILTSSVLAFFIVDFEITGRWMETVVILELRGNKDILICYYLIIRAKMNLLR